MPLKRHKHSKPGRTCWPVESLRDIGSTKEKLSYLAEERLITSKSGDYQWPGKRVVAQQYVYDKDGGLKSKGRITLNAGANRVDVGPEELVIVELLPPVL